MLTVDSITVAFGGVVALQDVSLTVEPGEIVGVIGPNGSGKSTLFNAITGYVKPDAGRISLGDSVLGSMSPHRRVRRGLARTFQTPRIEEDRTTLTAVVSGYSATLQAGFSRSMLHDPWVSRESRRHVAEARELLSSFSLEAETDVQVGELPMGRVRIIDVARGMASAPSFLLLDEPAAGLSAAEQQMLASEVRRLAKSGVGVVLVEHNFGLVSELCQRVIVLERGRLIASGTPHEVSLEPRVVSAYLGNAFEETHAGPDHADNDHRVVEEAPAAPPDSTPLLEVRGLDVRYGRIEVCHGIDLTVGAGETVVLVGANGAGKSTLLKGIAGVAAARGQILLATADLAHLGAHRRPVQGLAFVPERRGNVFSTMTVEENLRLGEQVGRRRGSEDIRGTVLGLFPVLEERLAQTAGTLSGGEQQMLAIAMALSGQPDVLLLDEPTQGLAPAVLDQLVQVLNELRKMGIGLLVAEQNESFAKRIGDRYYLVSQGDIVSSGDAVALRELSLANEYLNAGRAAS